MCTVKTAREKPKIATKNLTEKSTDDCLPAERTAIRNTSVLSRSGTCSFTPANVTIFPQCRFYKIMNFSKKPVFFDVFRFFTLSFRGYPDFHAPFSKKRPHFFSISPISSIFEISPKRRFFDIIFNYLTFCALLPGYLPVHRRSTHSTSRRNRLSRKSAFLLLF